MVINIILAIHVISIIIIIHEFGHFIVAKANGITVVEFSLGFGPKLIHFKKGETEYSLKLLPFGGACIMLGEDFYRWLYTAFTRATHHLYLVNLPDEFVE